MIGTSCDPLADTLQTADGTLIDYISGSCIPLEGGDMTALSSANFVYEDATQVITG